MICLDVVSRAERLRRLKWGQLQLALVDAQDEVNACARRVVSVCLDDLRQARAELDIALGKLLAAENAIHAFKKEQPR